MSKEGCVRGDDIRACCGILFNIFCAIHNEGEHGRKDTMYVCLVVDLSALFVV